MWDKIFFVRVLASKKVDFEYVNNRFITCVFHHFLNLIFFKMKCVIMLLLIFAVNRIISC